MVDVNGLQKNPATSFPSMAGTKSESIWTSTFALLCLAQFLGYASHFLLTPTFPLYITDLGGSPFVVGLVLASFAACSVLLRPAFGYWSDRWSEAGVLISGLLLHGASMILCFVPAVSVTMIANGVRGIGWAGLNTGGYSLLASSAPIERRGEASGYYAGAQGSGTIFLPAIALWLIDAPFGGFRAVFFVSATLAFTGAAAALFLARGGGRAAQSRHVDSSMSLGAVIVLEREVLLPSAMLFCLHLALPAVTSFLVLYAREIGIRNIAWYYVVGGATNLLARPLLGRLSDKMGRARSLAAGFSLQILGLSLVVLVSTLGGLLVSGALFMLGNAIGCSTTLALAMDRANPQRRGRAMATFSIAYPLGAGVGSLVIGSAVDLAGYYWMFLMAAGLEAIGLAVAFINWSKLK
ncbi:MAG: MFS transporter [Deltaproteobacteria bacterium]|nr:MFS transporter [Deltaproteobacteria bacterium]